MTKSTPAPDAVRLVPVEPTEAMLSAGRNITERRLAPAWTARNVWSAMLDAAPAPAVARGGETYSWVLMRNDWAHQVFDTREAAYAEMYDRRKAEEKWRRENAHMADVRVFWNVHQATTALASQPQATGGAVELEASDAIVRLAAVVAGANISEVYNSTWCFDEATTFRADLSKALAAIATQPAPSPGGKCDTHGAYSGAICVRCVEMGSPLGSLPAAPSIQKGDEG